MTTGDSPVSDGDAVRLYQRRDEALVTLGLTLASLTFDRVEDVCDTILSLVVSELDAAGGAMLLCRPDPDGDDVCLHDQLLTKADRGVGFPATVPVEGPWSTIVRDLEPLMGPANAADTVLPKPAEAEGLLLAVPIISRGTCIGVLLVVKALGQLDQDSLIRTLRIISSVSAMAVVNVRNREAELQLRERIEAERSQALHEADERRKALAQVEQQLEIIREQEQAIRSLSSPIITVWDGVLALPVIGQVDAERANSMTDRLLAAVTTESALVAIVDLTGVEMVDTHTMNLLMGLANAVSLLGAECVLAGLSARVSRSLVQLGTDLGSLRTFADLRSALAYALKSSGFRVHRT